MIVKAKYQIAYKNVGYTHNATFEMDEKDYESYKNDVELVSKDKNAEELEQKFSQETLAKIAKAKKITKEKTKQVRKAKNK